MTSSQTINGTTFDDIKTRSADLWALCQKKHALYDALESIYLMKSTATKRVEGVKEVVSQDGRIAVVGGARLLSAGDPLFKVETSDENQIDESTAGVLETAALKMWKKSSEISDKDVVKDLSTAAVLFGEPHVMIMLTSELSEAIGKSKSKARKKQIENVQKATPALFRSVRPRNGIAIRNGLGMSEYYRKDKTLIADIRGIYPEEAFGEHKDTEYVDVSDYWSLDVHCVYIEGDQEPLLFVENERSYIPVYVSQADGSALFEDEADRNQPLLYAFYKSSLYERITELQTIAWTKTLEFGASPTMMVEGVNKTDKVRFNFENSVSVGYTPPGSKVSYPSNSILSPELFQLLEDARARTQEATIYGQTLGAPLGDNATFSLTSLLSQAGRLPLVAPAQAVSRCITNATKIALEMLAEKGDKHAIFGDIKLPETMDLTASVEVQLPQDMPKNAAVVAQLRGIVPDNWLLENLLNITDTDKARRQLTQDEFYAKMRTARVDAMVNEEMMKLQPQQPPMPGQGGGQGQPMPEQMPEQMGMNPQEQVPPEIMQQMMAQGGGQLPPEMMPGSPASGVPMQQPPMMPQQGGM